MNKSKEALEKWHQRYFEMTEVTEGIVWDEHAIINATWQAATKAMLDACCDFMIEIDDTYIAEGSLHKTLYDKIERWVGDE